ncbi:bL28 family ribosomal protein [Patescibacteria group bacterium]
MSRRCTICNKKYSVRTKWKKIKSKYDPVSKQRKYPNLQWVTLPDGKRIKACAKCIKAMNKNKKTKKK